jgi:electron transfer flavoprotein beta subunit
MAEMMDIPHVAYVRRIEEIENNSIRLQRLMDEGYDVVEADLPVLLTVVRELNEPRLPSLRGKMAAKKAEIIKWTAKDIGADEQSTGLPGSPTQVKNIFAPEARSDREMLEGEPEEQAERLIEKLRGLKCL